MANEKRLIDANALTNEIIFVKKCLASEDKAGEWTNGYRSGLLASLEEIYQQPTVEAVEVVHGRWVKKTADYVYYYACSECGEPVLKSQWGNDFFSDYCPNCGAKMD